MKSVCWKGCCLGLRVKLHRVVHSKLMGGIALEFLSQTFQSAMMGIELKIMLMKIDMSKVTARDIHTINHIYTYTLESVTASSTQAIYFHRGI